jgi:DNA-binding CsgD family transcriptional regulator
MGPKENVGLLERVALGLELLPILAFLTDSQNRIVWVNRAFARTIGDPMRDKLPAEERFVPAAVAGPYRERFPRWKTEISRCLASLYQEVEAGRLSEATLRLVESTLAGDPELRRVAAATGAEWDGTMVVRDTTGRMTLVREEVVSVEDSQGTAIGFHASLWFPADRNPCEALHGTLEALLTPRQLEIARLFASGLTAEQVASGAGISWRTAKDHLDATYERLGVHTRAELALLFAHEGLL